MHACMHACRRCVCARLHARASVRLCGLYACVCKYVPNPKPWLMRLKETTKPELITAVQ